MDLRFTAAEDAFRAEVRAFLAAELPAAVRENMLLGRRLRKQDLVEWQQILYRHGWGAGMWPKRYGGTGWSVVQQHIFDEECAGGRRPGAAALRAAHGRAGIMTFGNGRAARATSCRGSSRGKTGGARATRSRVPARTWRRCARSAVRDGDHYVVNGQKTWNTLAQYADWIFCLVRTQHRQARPQEGISFLLIDMKTPGVSVHPIVMLDGEHEINDVFFEDVRVPVENLVGEENRGWTYAKFLLGHERTNNRRHRQLQARARPPEADRGRRAGRRAAAHRRRRASAITSRRWSWSSWRSRSPTCACSRKCRTRRATPGPEVVAAEDQGLADRAAADRAADAGPGPRRAAVRACRP